MAAGPTRIATVGEIIPSYWDSVLGENLYPNLYFYQLGTKRTVPRNFGNTIRIPRLVKQNIVAEVSASVEGTPIAVCALSTDTISGTMSQFAGAYSHSDLLIFTALSDVVELSIKDIARDIAKKIDTTIIANLSAAGTVVTPTSLVTSTQAASVALLDAETIIESVVTLDAQDNPRPADNHYPTVIHPKATYDLLAATSAGTWLDVHKYVESDIANVYRGEIGRMFGARFVTSSNLTENSVAFSVGSGMTAFMFAPDSYYVTEINELTARTYVKQLGSGGTADPVNQVATVGAKVYFGVVVADWTATEYRMVRIEHGLSL